MSIKLKPYKTSGCVAWDVYNIVRDAFCPYRGIKVMTPAINQNDLIKNMQFDMYIKIIGEKDDKKIVIAILGRNEKGVNEIVAITEKFRLFLNNIKEQDSEIILISPVKFQTHVLNYIAEHGLNKRIYRYDYDNFKIVVPLGPGCGQWRILSPDEAKKQIEIHNLDQKEMKKVYTYDAQIIWLGAQPGDIVWINRFNPLSGRSSDIRRVVKGELA
jgi:DNA-directed RNA polymerase subunit H (RpoH/RPB5)